MTPEQLKECFERYRSRAAELARWDLLGPFHFSGVAETNSIQITFASELGAVAQLFPKPGTPYTESKPGAYAATGRGIHFRENSVWLTLSTQDSQPPPWDQGIQDALLKTIATELRPFIVQVSRERWTNSPFEENDPPPLQGDKGRDFIDGLTEVRVLVRFDVDYFTRPQTANPDLEVVFANALTYTVHVGGNPAYERSAWLPPGTYSAQAQARVYSQGLCKWVHANKRSHDILWRSAKLPIELKPLGVYRFAIRLPQEQRVLTEAERAFMQDASAQLEQPREILNIRLVEEAPSTSAS